MTNIILDQVINQSLNWSCRIKIAKYFLWCSYFCLPLIFLLISWCEILPNRFECCFTWIFIRNVPGIAWGMNGRRYNHFVCSCLSPCVWLHNQRAIFGNSRAQFVARLQAHFQTLFGCNLQLWKNSLFWYLRCWWIISLTSYISIDIIIIVHYFCSTTSQCNSRTWAKRDSVPFSRDSDIFQPKTTGVRQEKILTKFIYCINTITLFII